MQYDYQSLATAMRPLLRSQDVILINDAWWTQPMHYYLPPDRYRTGDFGVHIRGLRAGAGPRPERVWVVVFDEKDVKAFEGLSPHLRGYRRGGARGRARSLRRAPGAEGGGWRVTTGRGFGGRELLVLAGLLATACFLRASLIAEETAHVDLQDLRGFLSDLLVSLFLLAVLLCTARVSRIAASLLVAAWVLLHFANYETVRELGAPASVFDIGFAGDRTFLLGSAAAVSRPVLLVVLLAGSVALAWVALRGAASKAVRGCVLAATFLLGCFWLWPWSDDVAVWRQTNVVQQNLRLLAALGPAAGPHGAALPGSHRGDAGPRSGARRRLERRASRPRRGEGAQRSAASSSNRSPALTSTASPRPTGAQRWPRCRASTTWPAAT